MKINTIADTERLVLVADDQEIKRYTTRRVLERAGMSVRESETGLDTLRLARELHPAAMVLDIRLPDMDGYEVCRRLKEDPDTATIQILHFSALETTSADKVRGLQSGADGYLTLPVDNDVLVETVEALLRQHGMASASRSIAHHWQSTFHAIADAICVIDAAGNIQDGNRAFELLIDRPVDVFAGTPLSDLLETLIGAKALAEAQLPLSPSADLPINDAPKVRDVKTTDGSRWLRITIDPVVDGDRFAGAVCILSNISAEKTRESYRDAAYEREKRIAETLQNALLTPSTEHSFDDLEVESLYVPAWDEALVGGDLFDVIVLDNDQVALVVADASGKGLAAAVRTAEVKHALRAFLWEDSEPSHALERLNDFVWRAQLSEHRSGFVAAALIVLDRRTGAALACTAGAEFPLLRRANGEIEALGLSSLPLGIERGVKYQAVPRIMALGDAVILLTDGITEARRDRDFFGYERLSAVATAVPPAMPLIATATSIFEQATDFARGALHDDVCLLLARRRASDGTGGL